MKGEGCILGLLSEITFLPYIGLRLIQSPFVTQFLRCLGKMVCYSYDHHSYKPRETTKTPLPFPYATFMTSLVASLRLNPSLRIK